MSSDALDIYRKHLNAQLGVDGVFTQRGIFDPAGLAIDIYGVFDDNTFRSGMDSGNQNPLRDGARFILSFIPDEIAGFDVYDDYEVYLEHEDKQLKINFAEKDSSGAQVFWFK